MFETLLVYSMLTSAMFYLGSRAVVTRWLWSRYPAWFASFMDCSACSGFWFGMIVHLFWMETGQQGIRGLSEWYSPIVVGLCSIVWTPIVAGYMQAGFERLGSVVGADDGLGSAIEDKTDG